jgi:predicted peptidase
MDKKRLKKLLIGDFSFWRLLKSIVVIYLCLTLFALVASDRLIFQPQPPSYADSDEIIKLNVDDDRAISALHLVNPDADFTVLYSHGNAEDLGDLRFLLEEYRNAGFSVFAYDYSGYGTSEGTPSTQNVLEDADAALDYLVQHEKIPLDRIIIHGRSVGGGPAVYLAEKNDVAGLIVESSFVSAFRVVTRFPLVPFDKFRNISRIDNVNCPLLVIHGREDEVIPFWHGQTLFDKAIGVKQCCWLDDTSHNYVPNEARQASWAAIALFADLLEFPFDRISTRDSAKLKAIRDSYGSIPDLDKIYENRVHPNGLPYHIYVPRSLKAGKRYPLVLFLHGYSDLTLDTHKGFPKGVWSLPLVQEQHPHVLFVPRYRTFDDMWCQDPYREMVLEALDDLVTELNAKTGSPGIDPARIYLTGFSQGGMGTWNYVRHYPSKFAAASPLSGFFKGPQTVEEAEAIKHVPIWSFNGDGDRGVEGSRLSFLMLKKSGAEDVRYHEYAQQDHVIDDFAYFTDGFCDWLFAQKMPSATPAESGN